jgi:hypothetical protein
MCQTPYSISHTGKKKKEEPKIVVHFERVGSRDPKEQRVTPHQAVMLTSWLGITHRSVQADIFSSRCMFMVCVCVTSITTQKRRDGISDSNLKVIRKGFSYLAKCLFSAKFFR